MEGSDDFPGFQTSGEKDELVLRRTLSRLQRRAPRPLQLKPTASMEYKGAQKPAIACNLDLSSSLTSSSSSSSSSSFATFYHSKDPIPLLSPLVLPSLLESAYVNEDNTARSN